MSRKYLTVIRAVAMIFVAGIIVSCGERRVSRDIELHFDAYANGEPLVFNEYLYTNPAGDQPLKINRFRFFVTNIIFESADDTYAVPESYYLARFDNDERRFSIFLSDVPLKSVERITFSIGPDAEANASINTVGDLDPNSQMAWNWEVGYKFLVFEGAFNNGDRVAPLVYHVGFNENRRDLTFFPSQQGGAYIFRVDAMALIKSKNEIDVSVIPSVKFDKHDAKLLADNYATMIALTQK